MKKYFHKILDKILGSPWTAILTAFIALVAGHLAAILISHKLEPYWVIALPVLIIPVFYVSYRLYEKTRRMFFIRTLSQSECEPHEAIIILLSTMNIEIKEENFPIEISNGNDKAVILGNDLGKDIDELDKIYWNWQQLLRSLKPHYGKLKNVYLVGSKDTTGKNGEVNKGSSERIDFAKKLIKKYCIVDDVKIKSFNEPIDFENFKDLSRCLDKIVEEYLADGINEQEIIIDVTGGKKTTSIAGAITTLNKYVTFQYVDTSYPNTCWAYDVSVQKPASTLH